ncbi:MAG: hypothetical protein DI629_12125 [Mesorhizobium amorphae]|nr:MAG: hypothetical protein DI629_12125 [Mesorhizobium amorphae]
MSLARIAARISVVEALKGKTLVGDRVLDSQIAALEADADGQIQTDEEAPFIAVYTDAATSADEQIADNWLTANGETEIIIEIGITAAMLITNPDTGEGTIPVVGIPGTDSNLEFFLDMVARQAMDALREGAGAWADVFQGLLYHVVKIERLRAASEAKGVRLAGQQIRLTVHLFDDPVKVTEDDENNDDAHDDEEAVQPFLDFLTAMEGSGSAPYVQQAAQMRAVLGL